MNKVRGTDILIDSIASSLKKAFEFLSVVLGSWALYALIIGGLTIPFFIMAKGVLISKTLVLIAYIAYTLIYNWLTVGFIKLMFDIDDKKISSISTLFSGNITHTMRLFGGTILYSIICVAGLLLLLIPGLIFAARFAFFPYFIIEKNMSVTESLDKSWKITHGYTLSSIGLYLFSKFITIIMPWKELSNIHFYKTLTHQYQIEHNQIG